MAETMVQPKRVLNADETRFKLAEYERNDWILNVPHGTELEDCLPTDFWAHIAAKLRPYDHIEIRAEDGSWLAYVLVLGCDRNWAKVHVLEKYELTDVKLAFSNEAKVIPKWTGPQTKWRAQRVSDGAILSGDEVFLSKDDVIQWIRAYEDKL